MSEKQGCCCGEQGKSEDQHASSGGPMAMGMGMANKMMAQMGQGGSPMEMMRKMMKEMGGGEGQPPMDNMMGMCMGMCSEMLNAIRETNALAVHGTPELQHAFAEWLHGTEERALKLIAAGQSDQAGLATALKLSDASVRYVLNRLAESGKIMLSAKANS